MRAIAQSFLRVSVKLIIITKQIQHHSMINLLTVSAWLLFTVSLAQFSPIWQASPYIEAKSLIIVNNNQKTYGTYALNVTFASTYTTPTLVLAIPQLRVVSSSALSFKIYDSSLTSTGFIHNLIIPDASTTIWYMTCRYIVFNTAVLTKEFQTYFVNNIAGGNIASAPNGAYRSDSYPITLNPAATVSNNPICLPFLAGVTGTSTDNYQLNLTCVIQNSASATVTATAYPSTVISFLSFYAVIWDPVVLAVQSYFFVEYAVTATYYNVQKSFLSLPNGYIDANYIGGLASFSTSINQELNVTLNNLNITTTQTSLYDSVPQFQVRTRNCSQNSYPWFNKADGLCYPICPNYTYAVSGSFICNPCPSNCKTCLNGSVCTSCSTGLIVSNNSCICDNLTYLYNGVCYGCHYSCLTCSTPGQYYNCLTCDSNAFRTPTNISSSNSQCTCISGYTDVFTTVCSQICGDGVAHTDACDDGNTNSGDGCSSSCTIQQNFTCPMSSSNFSSCFYIANVTISEVKTFKMDYENTITVYLQVSPWIDAMSQLANSVCLTSNFSSTSSFAYDSKYGLLVYSVSYKEHLEGKSFTIFLNPSSSGIFSRMPGANTTWQLNSDNGYKLNLYTDVQYQVAQSFHYLAMIFGYLILGSAFLYIFGRLKWMGNLLFFSLQFQYLSMVIIPVYTPMLAGLSQIKTVMGYNEAFGQQQFDLPKYQSFSVLNFSKQYLYNVNVMISLQVLAIVMYVIYYITYRNNELLCKKYGGDPQKSYRALKYGKFLQFFDWEFFMFWTFYNMTEQITSMILFSELYDPTVIPLMFFNGICIILAIFPLLARRKQVKSYTVLLYCADRGHEEQLFSLICFFLMYGFLAMSLIINKILYYIIFIFPVIMIIYLICRKPFQSKWMRAAYFINCFCIIIFLIYNQLVIGFQDDVYYLPFGSIITILLDWIFNLVVWGRQAYVICKYGGERDLNELLQSNTKTSSIEQDKDNYFKATLQPEKGNQSFLNSIIKNQGQSTRRPLNRKVKLDEDTPDGLKEEHQAQLEEQQQIERDDLKKRREKWMKQMKEMKQIRSYRERTRSEIQASHLSKSPTKSKIRSTGQKGVEQTQMKSINDHPTGRII